jgi:copper transport protein
MIPFNIRLFVFLSGMLVSGAALAHAELLDTTPSNGSVMASSPEEFLVIFSEPVSMIRTQLIDGNREKVALDKANIIDNVLRFKPHSALQQGQYLLSFRVLSLDAHPVSGSVGFAIGNLPAPLPEFTQVDGTALTIARVNRTIYLLSILVSMGLVLFPLLFTLPDELESRRQIYLNLASVAGIVTAITGLGLWGVLLTEASLSGIIEKNNWSIAMSTSLGTSFTLVVGGLIGIMTATVLGPNLPPGKFSNLLGVILIIFSLGVSGHAASSGWLMSSVFVTHALMAGIWLGALWLLYRCLYIKPVSMICALVMAWNQFSEFGQLFRSDYGFWLLIKLGLVSIILVFAAYNRWRLTPVLNTDGTRAHKALRRSIFIEGLLMVIVVAVTSVLASTPPPSKGVSSLPQMVLLTAGDNINLELTITPARTGINTIAMAFTKEGDPINPIEVDLVWQQLEAGIEPQSQEAVNTGAGIYRIDNVSLIVTGNWQFKVEALIDDFTRERFETELQIN